MSTQGQGRNQGEPEGARRPRAFILLLYSELNSKNMEQSPGTLLVPLNKILNTGLQTRSSKPPSLYHCLDSWAPSIKFWRQAWYKPSLLFVYKHYKVMNGKQ